jgi:small-conductance mechanosensitive channel
MNSLLHDLDFLTSDFAVKIFETVGLIVIAFVLSRVAYFILYLGYKNSRDRQRLFILKKGVKYTLTVITLILALKIFGVDLKVILGAAGVLSLAVGFAAQTSVSNLISGLFLIFEKPFVVGDVIEVGSLKGELLSIDLLSMRIKTVDNLLVRVPNEIVMKSQVTNLSFFPIRRLEFLFSVAYNEDLEKIKRILLELTESNPYCLDEPVPLFLINKWGEYSIEIKFGVWCEVKDLALANSTFGEQLRAAFIRHQINLPLRSIKLENPAPQIQSSVSP